MTNIPDKISQDAFKYVEENKKEELKTLLKEYPGLIETKSEYDNATLFIRACKYLSEHVIDLLLDQGVDVEATDRDGYNGIASLFHCNSEGIRNKKIPESKILKILKKISESKDCKNVFTDTDSYKNTPLIEAARARLPKCIEFIIELMKEDSDLLKDQLLHKNKKGENALSIALKNRFFNNLLTEKTLESMAQLEKVELITQYAVKISSPTVEKKNQLLSLLKKNLTGITEDEASNLLHTIVFKNKLYEIYEGTDTTFHQQNLQNEIASGNFGTKIFNSIDIKLVELFSIAHGVNLEEHKNFVDSLLSLKQEELKGTKPCSAVILEHNKQKLLGRASILQIRLLKGYTFNKSSNNFIMNIQ